MSLYLHSKLTNNIADSAIFKIDFFTFGKILVYFRKIISKMHIYRFCGDNYLAINICILDYFNVCISFIYRFIRTSNVIQLFLQFLFLKYSIFL